MPAGPEATWAALSDIEAVAACMPGASISERIDERHYRGSVTVRVGPATLAFRGDIEVKEQDAATHSLRLVARGTDSSGASTASLDLTARVEGAPGGLSLLVGTSEAAVTGRAATFGARVLDALADQILRQFADNFAAHVALTQRTSAGLPAAAASPAGPAASARPAPQALNGLALLWAICKGWLRGLFAGKA
jgi:carbon monoxide dehydrogenase subunit G